MQVQTGYGA